MTARPQRNERLRERAVVELAGVNVLVGLISLRAIAGPEDDARSATETLVDGGHGEVRSASCRAR